ncbi:DASS family sodium-coupled anion symporter [Helicobacter mustelae]|uniref:Sodium:sulfate symporter-family protein n=1 Tax=Helicobacter mustelae (strain ATCC 43772 / CCUG 25715 / CIP 103759 / LMG 18044 / NCTC 12198 / R85-136P) TaxID=679897 RepID=D3UIK3_HELM1|nr:DASS family sodium-coupled anion symporter [Helicobacter mustelae]CBG40326.1 Sodium:sulfate symporter-family protein [Helicobacter mustelae 12198]SQH71826.1 sodium:sulfate symporter-family protein [Helicobacter mustelae]
MSNTIKTCIVIFDFVLFFALIHFLPFTLQVNQGLAILAFAAILWLSEAVHVTITALLIPILAILTGLLNTKNALISFANPIIFLFFGGFVLAATLHHQELDKIIAARILKFSRGSFVGAVFLIFLTTAFLSMWMSNTAIAAMMLPLAIGILSKVDSSKDRNTFVFVLLGVAYSASIGGMGTLVGTPPNAIVASNLHISFSEWLYFGIPIVLLFMPLMMAVLYIVLRPKLNHKIDFDSQSIPPMDRKKTITLGIFIFIALCWTFSKPLNSLLSPLLGLGKNVANFDSVIALIGVALVCIFRLIEWKQASDRTDWGVLLLFGGGLTLSVVLKDSGASKVMAESVVWMIEGKSLFIIGIIVAFFVVFLTEFTSNTASAALLVPLFISIAQALGAPPLGLALIVGFAASCAFMLPVATPPNAVVYGTGYIRQNEMIRVGIYLNIFCAIILGSIAYSFWL